MSKKPLLGLLVAFIAASVVTLAASMAVSLISGFGLEFALACFRLADGWVFGILIVSALSLIERIRSKSFTASYITGLVFVVLAALSFFVAITAASATSVLAAFVCFILFGVCSIVIPKIIAHIKRKGSDGGDGASAGSLTESDFENQWARVRARLTRIDSNEKKIELLEKTLLYFPKELDINNGLDFNEPVMKVGDDLYTVAAAVKNNVASSVEIDTVKALVAGLINKEGK